MDTETLTHAAVTWIAGSKVLLIKAGGVFNTAFAIFHLAFWRLFSWRRDLRTLTFVNRGIVQVMNLCLIMVFAIFAFVSFLHADDLLSSPLGHSLIALIALFWFARALEQVVFFRLRHWSSRVFFLIFLLGAMLYGLPAAVLQWHAPPV